MMVIQYMPDCLLVERWGCLFSICQTVCWLKDDDANSVFATVGWKMMMLIQYMSVCSFVETKWWLFSIWQTVCWLRDDNGNSVYARLFVGWEMRRLIQFMQGCLMMRYVNTDWDHTKLSVGGNMMMLIQNKVEYLLLERSWCICQTVCWLKDDDANSVYVILLVERWWC